MISPVRFTDGRQHLKISVLIALFAIPGGIRNGIDVCDAYTHPYIYIYIIFPSPGKQLVHVHPVRSVALVVVVVVVVPKLRAPDYIQVSRNIDAFECARYIVLL
jgi:hypothetical protein